MRRSIISILLLTVATATLAQITGISSDGKYFTDAKGNRVGKVYNGWINWNDEAKHGVFTDSNDKKGVVNQYGKEVLPPQFYWVHCYPNYIEVTLKDFGEQIGTYNYNYQKVYDFIYNSMTPLDFGPGFIELEKDGKRGMGDTKGKILVPLKYDYVTSGWNEEDKKLEVIVSNGGQWKNFEYCGGKTWGVYINDKLAVPCEYDTLMEASEDNIYMVKKNGKWGYYGNGRELVAPQYDAVTAFDEGVATVRKDGEVKMIKNPLRKGDDIQIAGGGASIDNKKKVGGPAVSRYPAPDSDVDKNIPVAKSVAENTFAFIIANENYADAPVPYSLNDGRMFREYCQKTLGLPEKNINMYEDATFGNIITAVEKMKQIADAYEGDATVIFYYAGHGFPDDKQATAYLLPIDGDASSITTTGYSLAKLYKEIAALKLKSALVFLDACFSGAKREDQMLASSRGVAIKVKEETPQGNMLVFSAAQGDETAHQMEDKHHGLFTYFLLKELQTTQGDVNMGTLTEYVTKQVKRQSVVINNKKQTPTVVPSAGLAENWRTIKLK